MYPFIKDGDVITVSPLRARGLRVGEVAAFRSGEDRLVIHRVIAATGVECEVRATTALTATLTCQLSRSLES